MNEFIKIKKEAVFFNTKIEMKENLSYNLKYNNVELKGKALDKQKYELFGYVDFEDDERKYRYKNKVIITLTSIEKTKGIILLKNIEINLIGGIQILGNTEKKISKILPYPEKNLNLESLKYFIIKKVVEELSNELITEQEQEKFKVKKIFIKENEILLEDIRMVEGHIKNTSIPVFN